MAQQSNHLFFVLTSRFFTDIETLWDPDEGVDAFKTTPLYVDIQRFVSEATDTTNLVFKMPVAAITTHEPFVDVIFSQYMNRRYFSYDDTNEHLYFTSIDNVFHGLLDILQQILAMATTHMSSPRSTLDLPHFETLWHRQRLLSTSIERIMTALDVETIAESMVDLMA